MTKWKQQANNVFFPTEDQTYVSVSGSDIDGLSGQSAISDNSPSRLCAHKTHQSQVHEMFVSHMSGTLIPPHKRKFGSESYLIIVGQMVMVFYDDCGNVRQVIDLSSKGGSSMCYVRMEEPVYRGIHIVVDTTFLEIKQGPFDAEVVTWANWASELALKEQLLRDSKG